jgi:protein-L-isoaspartate(D-aspartate) O-methyltransferase
MVQRIKCLLVSETTLIAAPISADDAHAASLRREMVERQLRKRGIHGERVLSAMLAVPRHIFVPAESLEEAYSDRPLEIGEQQTISQPFMVAFMAEALELTGGEKLLDVGAGSGYSAAVHSRLAARVFAIELSPILADRARHTIDQLSITNVALRVGDGSLGWPEEAPFDAICVAAAAPSVPHPLTEQLAEGGRLVIPIGSSENQDLIVVRKSHGGLNSKTIGHCRFVPLTGKHGFVC